jgi:hypothetical protein
MKSRIPAIALALLLVGQVTVYAMRRSARPPEPPPPVAELQLGARFDRISGTTADGRLAGVPLASSAPYTVVLAYDPACAHSARVAEEWKRWLATPTRARVLAIARGTHPAAAAYGKQKGWKVDPVAVSAPVRTSLEYNLLRRTPWVYVFDSHGALRLQAHGSELAAVDSLVAGLTPAVRPVPGAAQSRAAGASALGFTERAAPRSPRSGGR